jgi:hypothetical protein
MGKGYKNICTGNVPGNAFNSMKDRLLKWIEKGSISFVELVEVSKREDYKSVVRRPKKQTAVAPFITATLVCFTEREQEQVNTRREQSAI